MKLFSASLLFIFSITLQSPTYSADLIGSAEKRTQQESLPLTSAAIPPALPILDEYGRTTLHRAASSQQRWKDILDLTQDVCPLEFERRDCTGQTPLMHFLYTTFYFSKDTFTKAIALPDSKVFLTLAALTPSSSHVVSMQDHNGGHPLLVATSLFLQSSSDIKQHFYRKVINFFVNNRNACPALQDNNGASPLLMLYVLAQHKKDKFFDNCMKSTLFKNLTAHRRPKYLKSFTATEQQKINLYFLYCLRLI